MRSPTVADLGATVSDGRLEGVLVRFPPSEGRGFLEVGGKATVRSEGLGYWRARPGELHLVGG